MRAIAAVPLLALGLGFMVPVGFGLVPVRRHGLLLPVLTTFGLSVGILTLEMFWFAVLARSWFHGPVIVATAVVMALVGLLLVRWRVPSRAPSRDGDARRIDDGASVEQGPGEMGPIGWFAVGGLALILTSITTVGVYYPFVDPDALSNYSDVAWRILQARGLDGWKTPKGQPYTDAYPLLIPLAYVYTYLASGSVNQHLAKTVPVAFAWATVGATYCLGREMLGRKVGLLGSFLVAATPLFSRWGPSGYVDVPLAFYFTCTVLFAFLYLRERLRRWALLTGVFAGFALWTKAGGLLVIPSLALVAALVGLGLRRRGSGEGTRRALVDGAVAAVAVLGAGGFWYLRNVALYGVVFFPIPGNWMELYSDRSLANLLPFFKSWDWFGGAALAPVYSLGVVYALMRVVFAGGPEGPAPTYGVAAWAVIVIATSTVQVGEPYVNFKWVAQQLTVVCSWVGLGLAAILLGSRMGRVGTAAGSRLEIEAPVLVLLAFAVPFTLVWWRWFSYDPRFLLAILPLLALMGAWWAAEFLPTPETNKGWKILVLVGVMVLLLYPALRASKVAHALYGWWQNPWQEDSEKRMRLGFKGAGVYHRLRAIADRIPGVRVLTPDPTMFWYGHHPAFVVGYPSSLEELRGYSYLVWDTGNEETYRRRGAYPNEVSENLSNGAVFKREFDLEGYSVYRILFSSGDAGRS